MICKNLSIERPKREHTNRVDWTGGSGVMV
jgi:hypothetical protein